MWLIKRWVFVCLALIVLNQNTVFSQATHSPYSIIGIGDIADLGVPASQGMGGLGISNGSYWYLNNVNPALLYYNSVALFSAGIIAESKNIQQTGFEPYQAGSAQLDHLAMAFPLRSRKWSFSIVLQPYSSVGYNFTYDGLASGSENSFVTQNQGFGGFNQLNLSFGGIIYKGLSIGVKGTYLFSSIKKEFTTIVSDVAQPSYFSVYSERQSANDFNIGGGLAYEIKLGENRLALGLTYDLEANIKGTYFLRLEQQSLTGGVIFADTLSNNVRRYYTLPSTLGAGISYGKINKWLIGFDYRSQDWNVFDGSVSSIPEDFAKSSKYILGGEITPDASSIDNYAKRVTYRIGLTYYETPYVVNGTQINDFGINFGWTLPVARFSSLDFGFQIGNRGTLDNNLIREDYFRLYFGATFNDNRWFIQPKFN